MNNFNPTILSSPVFPKGLDPLSTPKIRMSLKLKDESALREAQASKFSTNAPSGGWVLLDYISKDTVSLSAQGGSGPEDLAKQFYDDRMQYALLRISLSDKDSKDGFRDVFVTWIGPGVKIMEKANKWNHLGDAEQYLQPHHCAVLVYNKQHFDTAT